MISREDRLMVHSVELPPGYIPSPERHLLNVRDSTHVNRAVKWLESIKAKTVLDVGCYDGWLDFLLDSKGYKVSGIELIPELAAAARRYAERNFINYSVQVGYVLDLEVTNKYDAVLCFETLEHMPLEDAQECSRRFSKWATKGVMVSLPDQDHHLNSQHLFTPTEELIKGMWGSFPEYALEYVPYPGTPIPSNWFISHRV